MHKLSQKETYQPRTQGASVKPKEHLETQENNWTIASTDLQRQQGGPPGLYNPKLGVQQYTATQMRTVCSCATWQRGKPLRGSYLDHDGRISQTLSGGAAQLSPTTAGQLGPVV